MLRRPGEGPRGQAGVTAVRTLEAAQERQHRRTDRDHDRGTASHDEGDSCRGSEDSDPDTEMATGRPGAEET